MGSLLRAAADELRIALFEWTLTRGMARLPGPGPISNTAEPHKLLLHLEELTLDALFHLKDFASHLGEPAVARRFREVSQKFARSRSAMVLTGPSIRLPAEIEHMAVHYPLQLPGREELRGVLKAVLASLRPAHRIQVGLAPEDLEDLLRALSGLTLNQARQALAYAVLEDGKLSGADMKNVLKRKAQMIRDGGLLEYFPAEDNRWQLGGFERLKAWLERARVGFSPEARALNLSPPRGILLVGVQGCGKSLAAKVIAREWRLPLLKLDAGRLFDKYIGESERNFRKAIAMAEAMAPVVLWIDEIEKGLAPVGGEADAGLSRRLFGAFLTWLQEKKGDVFVAATANDLSLLPPELLRKGRFDEIFFVDLPQADERKAILSIHLSLRKQDPAAFDLERIAAATEGFSGAEIEQAVVGALYRALGARRPLDTGLLLEEVGGLIPLSVSRREDIECLRESARGRFVNVR